MRKSRLATARPLLATADGRTVRPLPKTGDPELSTPEHRAWALAVKRRAGWKCEECGTPHGPECRLIADHIVERSDGGAPLDLNNGRALCPHHHGIKTAAARARRHGLASEIAP
ncbi:HNH endonuclease [Methylobacterium indicum]|uniref:HNH endonuclease n=1 Tax=Methylobacterium indicum TaxID=1775910 RepID=A0ABR5HES0_9HYPH|nr:HNH endonuclease [Methylobacterium indicum]KMO25066.1 HNH endonuclease [Methylobacterium indicum]